jgi:hypothetical protein
MNPTAGGGFGASARQRPPAAGYAERYLAVDSAKKK